MTDAPLFVPTSHTPPALAHRQAVYQNCRQAVAMAAGLEAMAVRAFEIGETTDDQLEHFAMLSSQLVAQLDHLSTNLATTPRP